jgi:hypothetical protein
MRRLEGGQRERGSLVAAIGLENPDQVSRLAAVEGDRVGTSAPDARLLLAFLQQE